LNDTIIDACFIKARTINLSYNSNCVTVKSYVSMCQTLNDLTNITALPKTPQWPTSWRIYHTKPMPQSHQ